MTFDTFRNVGLAALFPAILMALTLASAVSASAQTYVISGRVADGFGNGIAGAAVALSGTQAGTASTDTNGSYSFSNLLTGGNYSFSRFKTREFNPAFVLMQYYGYLRRDPDSGGYQFWLNILNNKLPQDQSGYRAMVCAFITSAEYQERFSSIRTHTDQECGPYAKYFRSRQFMS